MQKALLTYTLSLGSGLICLGASATIWAQQSIQAPPEIATQAREILRDLIAAKSIHANGSTRSAQLIADHLVAGGYSHDEVQVLARKHTRLKEVS